MNEYKKRLPRRWKIVCGFLFCVLLCNIAKAQVPIAGIRAGGKVYAKGDTLKVCAPATLSFSDASNGSPGSYSWIFTNGTPQTATTANPAPVTFTAAGVQKITLAVENNNGKDTALLYVHVSSTKPLPSFSFTANNSCANIPVQFTNGSTGATTYLWKFGDGKTAAQENVSHTYSGIVGTGTQNVTAWLIATNEFGCKDSTSSVITVKRSPDASIISTDLDVQLVDFNGLPTFKKCANEQNFVFNFRNASTTEAGNTKYTIDWGDGSPKYEGATLGNFSHPYTLGNHVMTLTIEGAGGCIGEKKYNVFLGTNPAGGIGSPGNTTVCGPQLLNFPISGTTNNPPGTQYEVTINDGSAPQLFSHPAPAGINHYFSIGSCGINSSNGSTTFLNSFKVTLDIVNPCGVSSSTVTPIYVSTKPKPRILFNPDSIVCVNSTTTIYDNSLAGNFINVSGASSTCISTGGTAWSISPATGWTLQSGTFGNLNGSNTNYKLWNNGSATLGVRFNTAGNYTITIYKGNDCGVDSIKRVICVREQPQANFTIDNKTGCVPFTATATNTSVAPPCGSNYYYWTVTRLDPEGCTTGSGAGYAYTGTTSSTSNAPSWSFSRPGKYVIRLTAYANGNSYYSCNVVEKVDTITVAEKPRIVINAAAVTCEGKDILPTATVSSCYSAVVGNYQWTFDGGNPASYNGSSPGAVTYATAGNYTIKMGATNGCGTTEATKPLQVVGLPIANAGADITICSGASVQLGAAPVTGYTYLWNNSTNLSNQTSASPVFTAINNTGTDVVYTLTLQAKVGAGCEKEDAVTVTVRPAPVVVANPALAAICFGDSVLVEASGAVSYSWSPAAGVRAEDAVKFWLKPTANTSFVLTGTDANNCTAKINVPITIKPVPNTEAGNNFVACFRNEEITLSGSPAGGIWSGPGTTANGGGYTFNPSTPGLGTHQLYYTATLNGCSLKDSLLVDVINLQNAQAGNDTTVCEKGADIQLTGIPAGGTWSGSPLVTAGGRFSPSAAGTYSLVYTFGAGSCRVSDEKVITVLPGIGNNTIDQKQDICVNTTPGLISGSNPSGGDGAYTFQWQESSNGTAWSNIASETNRDYQPPLLVNTMYYRRIVRTVLCYGPQENISNTASVIVHPDARASFTASRTTGCIPFVIDPSIISVSPLPERNGTFSWYANNVLIASTNTAAFPGYTINTENASVVIKLVTLSQWSCRADSMETTFVTVAGATASFTKDTDLGCTPLSVSFTNTSSRITGVQHQWDFGNGQTFTGAQPGTIVFQGSEEGRDTMYYITLSISNGCTVSIHKDSVLVKPKPKVIFGVDTTVGCSPMTVRINNASQGEPATYYWDFGNGDTAIRTTAGVFNYTYTTGIVDTFLLKLKMVNDCGADSLGINIVVVPNQIKPQIAVPGNEVFGCAPHTVNFVNTTIGASRYVWDFQDGTSTLVTSASPEMVKHTFTNPGTYQVRIRITNGCSDTTVIREVNVAEGPSAGFDFFKKPYCEKSDLSFTNISKNAESYLWRFGDGNTSIEKDPVHQFLQPGTYTVELIAYNSNPFGTRCSDTMRQQVEIVARPVAALQTNISTINCAPFTMVASVNPAGAINANWYFNDPDHPDIGVGFLTNHTYTKEGNYRIKVVVLSAAGCADSAFANLMVLATPEAKFETSDIITCSTDTTVSYNNTSTYSGADGVTWKWLIDGVAVATSKNLSYRFRLPAGQLLPKTYSVLLVGYNSFGCTDTAFGSVRMNPTPIAEYTVHNNNGCVPYALHITNRSQFADSYQWFLDGKLVSTAAEPNNILLTKQATTYTLVLVAGNIYGCNPSTVEYQVNTAPKPTATFKVPDSLSCNGILDVRMENTSTGATSYIWDFGDKTPREYGANPRHVYAQNGEYDLLLVADNGICKDTATRIMRVGIKPAAAFESDVTTGCKQVLVNFKNLSQNALSYVWDFGNGNYSGQKDPSHSYGFAGSPYTVKLTATGLYGCADTTARVGYIQIKTPPTAAFSILPSNIIEIPEYTFRFINESSGLKTPEYYWTFGDGNKTNNPSPVYTYQDTGSYQVSMIVLNTEDGCSDTSIQKVTILGIPGWLQVPNAFQPGSGRSELRTFLPKGTGLKEYKLQVFNGWGELIFETTKLDDKGRPIEGWDGTYKGAPVQQDAFVWKIQGIFLNGTEWKGMKYPGKDYKKVGTITLIK